MTDLADFLLARIAEDETAANAERVMYDAPMTRDRWLNRNGRMRIVRADEVGGVTRAMRECEAKRRVIEHHARRPDPEGEDAADLCAICSANGPQAQGWPRETLQLLALPYADHPDYRAEWRP